MKKLFIAAIMLFGVFTMNAQNVVREGKTFSSVSKSRSKEELKATGFTWKDSKGKEYPIYISGTGTGSCFVVKTSQKTGKEYRQYLGEELSKQICKELKVEYKPKNK